MTSKTNGDRQAEILPPARRYRVGDRHEAYNGYGDDLLKSEPTGIASWSWKMFTKITIVLAAALVLGTTSEALAGAMRPCSLDGVNPVLHGAVFGKRHPDVAKAYGFVKLSGEGKHGTWGLDPSVCGHA